jgi:hypothetical protein
MKKIYFYFNTLICVSFLFILDSCSANTSLALSSTLGSLASKNEIKYYNSINDNVMHANSANIFVTVGWIPNGVFVSYSATNSFLECNVPYLTKTVADIDPDWLKFITHFSGRIKDANQKV